MRGLLRHLLQCEVQGERGEGKVEPQWRCFQTISGLAAVDLSVTQSANSTTSNMTTTTTQPSTSGSSAATSGSSASTSSASISATLASTSSATNSVTSTSTNSASTSETSTSTYSASSSASTSSTSPWDLIKKENKLSNPDYISLLLMSVSKTLLYVL